MIRSQNYLLITTEIEQITQQIEEQEKKYYQLHEKMLNNQQLVQEINAQRTTIEDKFEEVAALQQLADTVNGNNPKKLVLNGICYKRI